MFLSVSWVWWKLADVFSSYTNIVRIWWYSLMVNQRNGLIKKVG